MPKCAFTERLLIDSSFYEQLIKKAGFGLLTKLMYINAKSKDYPREHNVMSEKCFNDIVSNEKKQIEKEQAVSLLKASFRPINEPASIEAIDNEFERNIKFAIELASKSPFRTIILTSQENLDKYAKNPHYMGVKSIVVKANQDAIQTIESMYKETILT
ncbi:MAG: hypothetical protein AABW85_00205 [archaeon]